MYHTHVKISRRPSAAQEENTPLLSYHDTDDGRGRWSLARRRSSAFLSFLSEPEDREGDEYRKFQRKITIYRIVFINLIYCIGVGIMNSFFIELIQTLACAEYYYDSSSPDSRFPTLPSAGDPSDLCSVAWVDKRTSQIATYADVLASVTGCLASLVLAKKVLPRFGRRTVVIGCVTVSLMFAVGLASLPTHYSFDPAIASTSTVHPTASLYLLLASCSLAGLLGAPQVAMPILSKVMVLDTCEEDEKTADFSMAYSSNALGMAFSAKLLRLVLPPLNINFSILHHSGPFSPFWMMAGVFALALVLVLLYLPETKPNLVATNKSRRSSLSSSHSEPDDIDGPSRETQPLLAARSTHPSRSRASNALRSIQDLLSPFGYLIPYKPHPEAKRDYKLPLMLCAMVFCDTISMIWSNLIVFCSTHLHFGPQDVTTLLGLIGSTKGVYTLLVLPHIVTLVRRMVKRRIREEVLAETAASMEEPSTETRIAKREKSIIITDRIVAIGGLLSDIIGFICMGLAASHLSTAGIYVSKYFHPGLIRLDITRAACAASFRSQSLKRLRTIAHHPFVFALCS